MSLNQVEQLLRLQIWIHFAHPEKLSDDGGLLMFPLCIFSRASNCLIRRSSRAITAGNERNASLAGVYRINTRGGQHHNFGGQYHQNMQSLAVPPAGAARGVNMLRNIEEKSKKPKVDKILFCEPNVAYAM